MKKIWGIIALVFLVSLSLSLPNFASAASTIQKADLDEIKDNLLSMGIESNTVDSLIEKIENGGILDADIMEPTEAISKDEEYKGDSVTITYTFPDGSRSQVKNLDTSSVSKPGQIVTFADGISGGSCQSGSFSTTCTSRLVSYQLATYGYSFYASYTTVRPGLGYGTISSAGKWNIWTAGGTYSNPSMRIITKTQTDSKPAEARLSGTVNLANSAGSLTRSLSLLVGTNEDYRWNAYY